MQSTQINSEYRQALDAILPPRHDAFEALLGRILPPREYDHKFSTTQVNLPQEFQGELQKWIAENLAAEDLHPTEKQEPPFHVTVKYGLHTNRAEEVEALLKGRGAIQLTFGNIDMFTSNPDYDVLIVRAQSPDLVRMNHLLSDNLPHTDTQSSYNPHMTLAYLKKGAGGEWIGRTDFADKSVIIDTIQFGPAEDDISKTDIPLGSKEFSRLNYERKLSPYEKRVDFEAARKVFDEDAWGADLKIREQVKKARDSLLKTVKERAESNALTPQWVGTMMVDTPPKVVDILADYLMEVWRKGRDLALKELPEKVSKGLADVKRFAGLEPTKAVEYLRNTRPWLIKGVIDDELKKQARFTLAEHLKGGRTLNETLGNLRDIFEPWIGDPTKITPTGQRGIGFPPGEFAPENILMAYRLENIIRTETVTSFAQGRAAVGDEAEDYVIGYELSAILDQRTCFRDFTLINSSRGAIPISAIHPGDMVLSGANCWRRVKACWRYVATNWRKLTFSDGRFIICTHTHPFWVRNQIGFEWIEAHEITVGDAVATSMDPASPSVDYGAGSGKGFKPATLRSLWPHISPIQQQSAEILLERLPHIMGENQLAETKTMQTMRQSPAEKMWYEEKVLFKEMLPDSELGIRCLPWLSERVQAQENGFGQRPGILLRSGMLSKQEAQPDPENMPDMSQILCRIQMPNGQSELLFPEMLAYGQRSESDRENSGQCFENHGNSIRTAGQNWKANGRFSYSAVAHPRDGRRILASGQMQGCEENARIDESRFSCVEIPLRDNFPSTCRAIKTSIDHAPEPIASGTINVLSNEPVTEIEWAYDLEIEGDHSYIANGLISHNTEICKAADGVKFPKDHRLAVKLMPALHYQCRTIPVFIVTDDLPVKWSTEAELDSVVRLIPEGFK